MHKFDHLKKLVKTHPTVSMIGLKEMMNTHHRLINHGEVIRIRSLERHSQFQESMFHSTRLTALIILWLKAVLSSNLRGTA